MSKKYKGDYSKEDWKQIKEQDKLRKTTKLIRIPIEPNPDKIKDGQLLWRYGIGLEDYNKLFVSQKGYCKICGRHQADLSKKLDTDHDHTTGIVRGLLCHKCNLGLGLFKDNIENLKRAIEYLSKF